MHAWQFTKIGARLILNKVRGLVPRPGQFAIRNDVAGLCRSDVGFVDRIPFPFAAVRPVRLVPVRK